METREILRKFMETLKGCPVIFTDDTFLSDLDLDSLDIVELQMMYEDVSGKELPEPDFDIKTVGDLLKLMV
jgi:acyl carrier protein